MLPKSILDNHCKERECNVLPKLEVWDSGINWTELFLYRKFFAITISDSITLYFLHWRYSAVDARSISTLRALYSCCNHMQSCQPSWAFITRIFFMNFSLYFICDLLRRAFLFKISGGQCSGRRGIVDNSVICDIMQEFTLI